MKGTGRRSPTRSRHSSGVVRVMRGWACLMSIAAIAGSFSTEVSAQGGATEGAETDTAGASMAAISEADREGERKFAGLNFGVGISLTFDTGSNQRVKSASIVDGVVRIDDEDDKVARVMLESHYFFTPEGRFLKQDSMPPGKWGIGPFVALQPGTDEIIEAIAVGAMLGFRRPDDSGQSWNIGIGYITDPNVDVLGDGFTQNQPPPGNETVVRLKETSQDGVVLLFSFSF